MADDRRRTPAGSLESGEREFHGIFVLSFIVFMAIAVIGQVLAGNWRSWLPGAEGSTSMIDGVKAAVNSFMPYVV
jgi:light-harvesting complex 1 beta chain